MTRRKSDSPQKAAMREVMQGYLKDSDISIKSGSDVNAIMRDMMAVLSKGTLDEELNEELEVALLFLVGDTVGGYL